MSGKITNIGGQQDRVVLAELGRAYRRAHVGIERRLVESFSFARP
jgi:hypothetical protein